MKHESKGGPSLGKMINEVSVGNAHMKQGHQSAAESFLLFWHPFCIFYFIQASKLKIQNLSFSSFSHWPFATSQFLSLLDSTSKVDLTSTFFNAGY